MPSHGDTLVVQDIHHGIVKEDALPCVAKLADGEERPVGDVREKVGAPCGEWHVGMGC